MNEVLLIAGMTAVTFLIRYPMLALVGKVELPKPVFEALGYVPPAVLSAIVIPALLIPEKHTTVLLALNNRGLLAGMAAALMMWGSKNLIVTIVVGMAVYLLLPVVFPDISWLSMR